MSIYSDLSKAIGTEPRSLLYPTIEQAYALEEKIKVCNSIPCFAAVFEYIRHLPTPINASQREVLDKLMEIFIETREKFE